jgi:hypothetical protein
VSVAPSDFSPQLSGALAVDEQSFSFVQLPSKQTFGTQLRVRALKRVSILGEKSMRKIILALAAVAAVGIAMPVVSNSANAETVVIKKSRHHHDWHPWRHHRERVVIREHRRHHHGAAVIVR